MIRVYLMITSVGICEGGGRVCEMYSERARTPNARGRSGAGRTIVAMEKNPYWVVAANLSNSLVSRGESSSSWTHAHELSVSVTHVLLGLTIYD